MYLQQVGVLVSAHGFNGKHCLTLAALLPCVLLSCVQPTHGCCCLGPPVGCCWGAACTGSNRASCRRPRSSGSSNYSSSLASMYGGAPLLCHCLWSR
jgi:hypothetical protein